MKTCNPVGIYLAAGSSKRFGSDKLTQPIHNKALGTLALATALESGLEKVIVVTKELDPIWLIPFLKHAKCDQVTCMDAHLGQACSIQTGLRHAELRQAEAIMVMLADQPFITVHMIDILISTFKEKGNSAFIASRHNGIICPPILFARHMFPNLYTLRGDSGAKSLLIEHAAEGTFLDFADGKPFYDIDTIHDYERVFKKSGV